MSELPEILTKQYTTVSGMSDVYVCMCILHTFHVDPKCERKKLGENFKPTAWYVRNEYQESSWAIKGGRRVELTTLPPSVSRLPRQNMGASTSHNPMDLHGLLQG
jgi:hypothetical protein